MGYEYLFTLCKMIKSVMIMPLTWFKKMKPVPDPDTNNNNETPEDPEKPP